MEMACELNQFFRLSKQCKALQSECVFVCLKNCSEEDKITIWVDFIGCWEH